LEWRVRWPLIIPQTDGHCGNKNLVAAISLLETIRNHKGCQMRLERKVGTTDMFLAAKNCNCFYWLMRSAAICSDTHLKLYWYVPYEGCNLPAMEIVLF
jgi:hypothetical protein